MQLIKCIAFFPLFVPILGWIGTETDDNVTEHAGYCHSKITEVGILKFDEEKQVDGMCTLAVCGNGYISYYGCGSVDAEPPCKVVDEDLSKPYPDCCPDIECPTEHSEIIS